MSTTASKPSVQETLERHVGNGRVRITFKDRKMAVPGKIHKTQDGSYVLEANWGLELGIDLKKVSKVEVKDLDSGKFVAA